MIEHILSADTDRDLLTFLFDHGWTRMGGDGNSRGLPGVNIWYINGLVGVRLVGPAKVIEDTRDGHKTRIDFTDDGVRDTKRMLFERILRNEDGEETGRETLADETIDASRIGGIQLLDEFRNQFLEGGDPEDPTPDPTYRPTLVPHIPQWL